MVFLVINLCELCGQKSFVSSVAFFVSFDEFRVLVRRVDAGAGVFDLCDEYIKTIFNGTQLLQLFNFFQRGLRQLRDFQ